MNTLNLDTYNCNTSVPEKNSTDEYLASVTMDSPSHQTVIKDELQRLVQRKLDLEILLHKEQRLALPDHLVEKLKMQAKEATGSHKTYCRTLVRASRAAEDRVSLMTVQLHLCKVDIAELTQTALYKSQSSVSESNVKDILRNIRVLLDRLEDVEGVKSSEDEQLENNQPETPSNSDVSPTKSTPKDSDLRRQKTEIVDVVRWEQLPWQVPIKNYRIADYQREVNRRSKLAKNVSKRHAQVEGWRREINKHYSQFNEDGSATFSNKSPAPGLNTGTRTYSTFGSNAGASSTFGSNAGANFS